MAERQPSIGQHTGNEFFTEWTRGWCEVSLQSTVEKKKKKKIEGGTETPPLLMVFGWFDLVINLMIILLD